MANRNYALCQGCGKKVEYTECSAGNAPPQDARCISLSGWLSVTHWLEIGVFGHYDFCSFDCLQKWAEAQALRIPKTFLEAFGDE